MHTQRSNPYQATAFQVPTNKGGTVTVREMSRYPEVPPFHASREVRRAIKGQRLNRLPGEWRQLITVHPSIREAIAKQ